MVDLRQFYDPTIEPYSGYEVLPAATYTVKVVGGDMKETKSGTGKYLQVEMEVVEGEYAGRLIYDRFNLVNRNEKAVLIAKQQLAGLVQAVGVRDPKDLADLMGARFQLVLKCERRHDDPDKMTNAVQRYIKKGQAAATPQQQASGAPWERNAPNPAAAPASEVPF